MNEKQTNLLPIENIQSKIFVIRGKKVLIDRHLAELYGVTTKNLNKAVSRNLKRFPSDFMFQLTNEEFKNLRFQFGTSSWGGQRYNPYVFTEQGVAMLSGVLHSDRAIEVNIQIMRVFIKLREMILSNKDLKRKIEILERKYKGHDAQIQTIFQVIHQLISGAEEKKQNKIGFVRE